MNVAVRLFDEIDLLREENRQLKDLMAPVVTPPREWALTGSEARLFAHLCARSMITSESAHAALYGLGDDRDPKIVDVFICKLRAKVKRFGVDIETIWGRGFSLKDRQRWLDMMAEKECAAMNVQQITFAVPTLVATNLAKRAGPLNLRVGEYARRLFDAAYMARISGERGVRGEDAALDSHVRQVFLLADCKPAAIAEALLLPEARVTRILDAWRKAAADLVTPEPASKPVTVKRPPVSPGERDLRSVKAWPEDIIDRAAVLWASGKTAAEVAAEVGKKQGAFEMFMVKNRDRFPKRSVATKAVLP